MQVQRYGCWKEAAPGRIHAFEMHACNQAAVSVGIIFLLQLLIELAIS